MSTDVLLDSLTDVLTKESPPCFVDNCGQAAGWACTWHNCPNGIRPAMYCDRCWELFMKTNPDKLVRCGHCHQTFNNKKELVGHVWRI